MSFRSCKICEIYLLHKTWKSNPIFANRIILKKKRKKMSIHTEIGESLARFGRITRRMERQRYEDKKFLPLISRPIYFIENIWSSVVEEIEGETSRACLGIMQRWINQVSGKIWKDIGRRINLRPPLRVNKNLLEGGLRTIRIVSAPRFKD